MSLEESYNPHIGLDVFKEDPNFQETEKKYEVGLMHFLSHNSAVHMRTASGVLAPYSVNVRKLTRRTEAVRGQLTWGSNGVSAVAVCHAPVAF